MKRVYIVMMILGMLISLGCERSDSPRLSKEEALPIIGNYLKDVDFDIESYADRKRYVADIGGTYRHRLVLFRYGADEEKRMSVEVDGEKALLLTFPLMTKEELEDRMRNLRLPENVIFEVAHKNGCNDTNRSKVEIQGSVRYLGGLKNVSCMEGRKVDFQAKFTHLKKGDRIVYLIDGEPTENSDSYICDVPGNYELQAVVMRNESIVARSPRFEMTIDSLPDELMDIQSNEHVHF